MKFEQTENAIFNYFLSSSERDFAALRVRMFIFLISTYIWIYQRSAKQTKVT